MKQMRLGTILVAALALPAMVAWSQAPFTEHNANSILRGAAVDAAQGLLYVSAYDVHEVWKIDLHTGKTAATVPVQEGPTSLALSSDGSILACANRIANSVSLIGTADFVVAATVTNMEGAADIAALPGGGFAVANSFGDNVALIDPKHPDSVIRIDKVASVPSSVAASDSFLAVTTRTPPALLLYAGGSHTPNASVPLPEGPSAVVALPGDRFAVGAKGSLLLIDAKTQKVVTKVDKPVYDIAVRGQNIYALTDGALDVYDQTLAPAGKLSFQGDGRGLAVGDGLLIVLVPKAKEWLLSGTVAGTPAPVVAEKQPEPAAAKSVAKAEPRLEKPAAPAKKEKIKKQEKPVEPVEPKETKPAEPAKPVEPMKTAQAVVAPPTGPALPSPAYVPPASTRKSRIRPDQPAVAPTAPPKPSFSRKPVESGFSGPPKQKGFNQTLTEGVAAGKAGISFQPPDWTQPFRDLRADNMQTLEGGTKIVADGNVYLTIDTVQFAADHLFYDKLTGDLHMSGNVEIVQGPSSAFADDLKYNIPTDKKLSLPPPLVEGGGNVDQELARKLLTLGHMNASNIEIDEPERQIKAERIDYDFVTHSGEAYGVEGHMGQIRFGGEKLKILNEDTMEGYSLWLTTCDCDHEYYKVRMSKAVIGKGNAVTGNDANLQLGKFRTPVYWPKWTFGGEESPSVGVDFDTGHKAKLGYYINVGQQFAISPDLKLGLRLYPTTSQGIGFGVDSTYDYMETPASPLFRGKGEFHTLYTTKGRGYTEWYHRQELSTDAVLLVQWEQWYDRDVYKDFYYDKYKDRTQPRTFANVTYTQPTYIASATVRPRTNGFTTESERLPEGTYHLLDREIADHLYLTFDTINGYNKRDRFNEEAFRSVNIARLSYDAELGAGINATPFLELEGTWYSNTRTHGSDTRFASTAGLTLSTRLEKTYPGAWGFSQFRHLIVPSITYSYRPEPTLGVEDTPLFDAYDRVFGRSRLESKIDNILMGRDAETGESWQVARLSLYQGTDFWNEISKSNDEELEMDLRPRPWWGFMAVGEHHDVSDDLNLTLDEPFVGERAVIQLFEKATKQQFNTEAVDRYNASYGSFDRVLGYFYYDDRPFSGRLYGKIGYAYTETLGQVFNREVIYGVDYKLNDKWQLGFEHVFDLQHGDLNRQTYEIKRVMQCVEGSFRFSERESGWDVGVQFSITALPGSKLKL